MIPEGELQKSYHKLATETSKAFAAFTVYRDIGLNRTVGAVVRKLGKSEGLLYRWASVHNWKERAEAFDRDVQNTEREASINAKIDWALRQQEIREKDFKLGALLREKAETMLNYPLVKRIRKDGENMIHIHPARWSLDGVSRMLEVSSKLQRLSANMATEKGELTGPDNTPITFAGTVKIYIPSNGREAKGEKAKSSK